MSVPNEKPDAVLVNALVYAMGDEADDIVAGFGLTIEERDQYVIVKANFDKPLCHSSQRDF